MVDGRTSPGLLSSISWSSFICGGQLPSHLHSGVTFLVRLRLQNYKEPSKSSFLLFKDDLRVIYVLSPASVMSLLGFGHLALISQACSRHLAPFLATVESYL